MCRKTPAQMVKLVQGHADFVEYMDFWGGDWVEDLGHNTKALEGMIFDIFGCTLSELHSLVANARALADDCEEDWNDRQL